MDRQVPVPLGCCGFQEFLGPFPLLLARGWKYEYRKRDIGNAESVEKCSREGNERCVERQALLYMPLVSSCFRQVALVETTSSACSLKANQTRERGRRERGISQERKTRTREREGERAKEESLFAYLLRATFVAAVLAEVLDTTPLSLPPPSLRDPPECSRYRVDNASPYASSRSSRTHDALFARA